MDGSVDRSIDRSIDHRWMDGFSHPSSHSSIHPLTPVGEAFMSFKRAAGEDLTFITQLIFLFCFKFFLLWDRSPLRPEIGLEPSFCPLLKHLKQLEILSFFQFAFLSVFLLAPLASDREGWFYFMVAERHGRSNLLFYFSEFTTFPPRRQPTTLVSARGPTAGTRFGNRSC